MQTNAAPYRSFLAGRGAGASSGRHCPALPARLGSAPLGGPRAAASMTSCIIFCVTGLQGVRNKGGGVHVLWAQVREDGRRGPFAFGHHLRDRHPWGGGELLRVARPDCCPRVSCRGHDAQQREHTLEGREGDRGGDSWPESRARRTSFGAAHCMTRHAPQNCAPVAHVQLADRRLPWG